MPKEFPPRLGWPNPFVELIGLEFSICEEGYSECSMPVDEKLLNPLRCVHGGVICSMADTGMGAAVLSLLAEDENLTSLETRVAYCEPVSSGVLTCKSKTVHKTRRVAFMEAEITSNGHLVAKTAGTYHLYKPRKR